MKTPTLETERLILRPISIDDAPAIQKHFNNWNIIQHLGTQVPWPYPDNGAETFLKDLLLPKIQEGKMMAWGITLKTSLDETVGLVHFRFEPDEHGDNRGFWIAEPYWGKGYMTEAVIATQDHLFFDLKLEKFTVTNAKDNKASRRIKEKTGAKYIGLTERPHNSGDTVSEHWEVTRENWARIRGRS